MSHDMTDAEHANWLAQQHSPAVLELARVNLRRDMSASEAIIGAYVQRYVLGLAGGVFR